MAEDSRKRRKLLHPQPDGFLPSKKPPQRIQAPKFQSAFASSSTSKPTTKPPSFPPRPQLNKPTPVVQEPKMPVQLRRQPVPEFPLHPDPQPSIPMKRQEPPTLQKPSRPQAAAKPLSSSSIFIKEPPTLPVEPTKPLQKLVVPALPDLTRVTTNTGKEKKLVAPALSDLSRATTNTGKEMKPISATHFAHLADISSLNDDDDDSVDLSSLLMRLQEHRAATESGLGDPKPDVPISPQKNKHIRGGLASRAAHLFKQTHTSLYLWRTSLSTSASSSDLTFRISKVVHTISTGSYKYKPCISITLCRILTPTRPFTSRKQHVYILLNLPDGSNKPSPLCNPENIHEGSTIHIWRPWHELSLAHSSMSDDDAIPTASLPLPSSNDSDYNRIPYDANNIHNTVLLCSRFSIVTQDSTS